MENEGNLSFLIPIIMVERFLSQTSFTTQEDFIKNFKINVPENFNFGYDVVDAWLPNNLTNLHCYGLMIRVNTGNLRLPT